MTIKFNNLSVNGGANVGGGIIEVNALPTENIKEDVLYKVTTNKTPVPVDGVTVVDKIYFDTTKSVDEVVSILDTLTEGYESDPMTIFMLYAVERYVSVGILKMNGNYVIGYTLTGNAQDSIFIFNSSDESAIQVGFVGWNPDFNGIIEFNNVSVKTVDFGMATLNVGTENDKMIDVMYTLSQTNKSDLYLHMNGGFDKIKTYNTDNTDPKDYISKLYRNVIKIRSLEYEFDAVFRDVLSYSRITNMQQFVDHIKASIDASDGFFSIDVNTPSNVEDFSMIYTTFNGEKATSDKDYKYEYSLTHKDGSTKKSSGCFDKNLDDLLDTSKFTFIGSACMKIV